MGDTALSKGNGIHWQHLPRDEAHIREESRGEASICSRHD